MTDGVVSVLLKPNPHDKNQYDKQDGDILCADSASGRALNGVDAAHGRRTIDYKIQHNDSKYNPE